ncbi:MAG: HEAT repeat domain-containing protein [Thermodesulfobacteriota bacterium]|nr:MAG: HEAT repeat domain-containing protein [Thermodesulfobacteriota bacterium]
MDSTKTGITSILNELNKAVKMHNFYPAGHPHFATALDNCFHLLKNQIEEAGEIKFNIDHKGFSYMGKPVTDGSAELADLAKKFFLRRIKELSITWRVTGEEIKNLIFVLRYEPDELTAMGGAEAVLAQNGVEGILLNEMHYEDLKKLKAELEEKKKKEEEEKKGAEEEEAGEGEALTGEESMAVQLGETEAPGAPVDEALEDYIKRLKSEEDLLKFNDLSVRIKERASTLFARSAFEEGFSAVVVFHEFSGADPGVPEEHRCIAGEQLNNLLTDEGLLRYLAGRAGIKEDPFRDVAREALLRCGERAAKIILEDAVGASEAGIRRNLVEVIVMFGNLMIPFVMEGLKSDSWYVVRQMVTILGELGDPEFVGVLEETYDHHGFDNRIKKEVLKSLARIPSPESTAFLLKALEDEDASLSKQAIVSLGVLRDPAAVESIGEIALKWEPFADRNEAQKEAIKALGFIGDRRAVEILSKIISRKSWFGKRSNHELKQLAVSSLGMIGGDEAFEAIEKVYKDSEGELYATCKRILDKREKRL